VHLPFFLLLNSLLLDNERWKQADVPAEFQDLVDSISDGKIALPEKKSGGLCNSFTCFFLILYFYFVQMLSFSLTMPIESLQIIFPVDSKSIGGHLY
jgi:hypothetical protein